MLNIVIVGNCQGNEVMKKLKRAFSHYDGFNFTAIRSYLNFTPADKAIIAGADLLLEQVGAFASEAVAEASKDVKQRIRFPVISSNLFWPLGPQAHPNNEVDDAWPTGPFPMQHGNPWLNERIVRGDDPQSIIDGYEALNIAKLRPLDRARKIDEFKWGQLEKETGVMFVEDLRQLIDKSLTFHAALHPSIAALDLVVAAILEQTPFKGMTTSEWRGGTESFYRIQIPIHPSIIDHFGFEWGRAAKFNMWESGPLTHKEWITRYVNYTPNHKLRKLMTSLRVEKKHALHLQEMWSMQESEPQSADLQIALALAYLELKDPKSALPYAEKAVVLWPNETESLFTYAKVLFQLARYQESADICRSLSALDPFHIGSVLVHNLAARQLKDIELAQATAKRMQIIMPTYDRVIAAVEATEAWVERFRPLLAKVAVATKSEAVAQDKEMTVAPQEAQTKPEGLPKRVKSKGVAKKKS